MKKTGLLVLLLATAAWAQSGDAAPAADHPTPQGTAFTTVSFPTERVQTPTQADLYCAGFVSKQLLPNANFVAGGLQTPVSTKFQNGEMIFLAGSGYSVGQQYTIVRELRDSNRYELFPGQFAAMKSAGQPYAELARVRVVDTRSKMAVAQIEFSCDPVNPGDIAVPYTEKQAISFHAPLTFDRFAPSNGKVSGRIIMAKDFDSQLGTGAQVYMNIGSNQGLKTGDYMRAVRSYSSILKDPVDSLSFKATTAEDTQKNPPSYEPNLLTRTKGPAIHVAGMPPRGVGEIVILSTTPNTATGMIVFALEDVHVGDNVELDDQAQ